MKSSPYIFIVISAAAVFTLTGCELFRSLLPASSRSTNAVQKPLISDLFPSAITTNSALVVWRTSKPANARVSYGTTSALGKQAAASSAGVAHSVSLSGLAPGTKYYFTANSYDPLGNSVTSALQNFTTENIGTDAAGPQVAGLSAIPNPTAGATAVSVSAVVSDASAGGSRVTAAEAFFDATGANGAGTALSAQDGVYNFVSESVNGLVSVSGLSIGAHTLYVHGRDASNNWGGFQSLTVTVSAGGGGDTTGPLTTGAAAAPNPTAGAGSITITASVSDAATGNAAITAAEYFVDTQGANGSGTAMTAQDGSFSSSAETVTASRSTSGLAAGAHTIYVHGRDALNNWGAAQSINLSVTTAGVKPDTGSSSNVYYTLTSGSPKPQEAVWIEDSLGNFVRTLFVSNHASGNASDLPTWYAKSGGSTDGTTGATKGAGSFTAPWTYPRNSANTVVPAGSYRYRIAVRQQGGAGESTFTGDLTLGASPASSSGGSGSFVTSLSADYTP